MFIFGSIYKMFNESIMSLSIDDGLTVIVFQTMAAKAI